MSLPVNIEDLIHGKAIEGNVLNSKRAGTRKIFCIPFVPLLMTLTTANFTI